MIKIHNFCFKKHFLIILPPPNITGELHIGHFFQYFIIDVIIKLKILQGYKIKFILGFDHAGLSAIIKFKSKKKILIQKKYLKKKYLYQLKYINFIFKKIKINFTLNKNYENIVKNGFKYYYKKKLIVIKKQFLNYYKNKIIPDCEVEKKIFIKYLFYIKYKIEKKTIIVSTSNLESLFYNTFLISKLKFYNEKESISPFKIKIKIYFEPINSLSNFKKYSPNINNFDFLMFLKKKGVIIINYRKKISNLYNSKKFNIKTKSILFYKKKTKKNIFKFLLKNNYIVCVKKYKSFLKIKKTNNKKIINLLFDQWFLNIKKILSFKKIKKNIFIKNKKYEKIFLIWIKNISSWCISRQINWGTKIPIFLDKEKNIYQKKEYKFIKYYKNKDVFDTWFNSSFWIIFVYSKLKKTHNIIVSGFDIIFYWIIKMLINNIFIFKKLLIKTIIIHGLIKDSNKKISKSTNNVLNFDQIKKNINKIRLYLIKDIFNDVNISVFKFKKNKKYFINTILNNKNTIIRFYAFKKIIIKKYLNYEFERKTQNFLKKNIICKKIFILITKIFFPIKKIFITKNWNFSLNFYINKLFDFKFLTIIKINNKILLIKNYINYFVIFFKIKLVFYVKQKNKTI
ncbi:class I tRNA ligase family protein [Candidatus Carsonella ruddii]|uniref:class I tRNA ligase family protein n=1 Tax=Carsonella ruddii TaxID=114186 RepID=UPI00035C039A|nr:class I tRNA ligase family protein [Candidatus Carsonella ruddii]AGS06623.1 valyl-tRNA synthetase [Candidatus Carsonella ruddii DC]